MEEVFPSASGGVKALTRCALDRVLPLDLREEEAAAAWLDGTGLARQGLLIPLHGPAGQFGLLVALSDEGEEAWRARMGSMVVDLHFFAADFFERHFIGPHRKRAARMERLSRREAECLYWCAQGKSYWETSRILGISERTVNHHMKMVREKLGVQTNAQAVWHASVHGLFVRFSGGLPDD